MAEKSGSTLAYAGIFVALLPVLIGLYEYKKNTDREFGKTFLNQQSLVYDELLGDLGSISTSISNPTDSVSQANYKVAKYNFNQLYYGKLNLYQSTVIENLTDSLYTMINNYDSTKSVYTNRDELELLIDRIQDKVYKLSVECKESLRRTYNLE